MNDVRKSLDSLPRDKGAGYTKANHSNTSNETTNVNKAID